MATVSRDLVRSAPPSSLTPHPHVVREAILLVAMGALVLPFALRLAGVADGLLASLAALSDQRTFRLWSGGVGGALIAAQLLMPALRRFGPRHPRVMARLRDLHTLGGAPLLLVVLAHTGGRAGRGALTGLLLALTAMLLTAQAGHVLKAHLWWRAQPEASPAPRDLLRNQVANGADGWLHQSGLQLHVCLAVIVLVLVVFHALSVFYF